MNIPVTVTVTGEGSLPAEVQVALYRLCQEALNNIAKHAEASQVEIDLQHEAGRWNCTSATTGVGFDPGQPPRRSLRLEHDARARRSGGRSAERLRASRVRVPKSSSAGRNPRKRRP